MKWVRWLIVAVLALATAYCGLILGLSGMWGNGWGDPEANRARLQLAVLVLAALVLIGALATSVAFRWALREPKP